jgi:hypothetical protein
MESHSHTDVWFFVGHSIGVTLLAIHTLEVAYFSLPVSKRGRCYLVINGEKKKVYEDMLSAYPHIEVVTLSLRSLGALVRTMWSGRGHRQLVFHPLSFGKVHSIHALISKVLVLWRRDSQAVVFGEKTLRNRFWFTDIVPLKFDVSIFSSMEVAVQTCIATAQPRTPHLLYEVLNPPIELAETPYIIVHPFAASVSRSLPLERCQELIDFLVREYPDYAVVISGGPGDFELAQSLIRQSYSKVYFNGAIVDSFKENISLIGGAVLFVGVDTGPTHIAGHVRVPTVVIGNNSNPCWLPTYSPNAVILTNDTQCTCKGDKTGDCFEYYNGVQYYRCMLQISQSDIEKEVRKKVLR